MPEQIIPRAQFGICGGSGSLSFDFPAALGDERVTVLARDLVFATPFGRSPAFTHFRVDGPMSNLPEFGAAFQCKPGDKMMRANMCTVW